MSDLYKEAIADAKKLREIAEEDARKSIMEKVSPYIKKMIAKETAHATSFFFEEEEDAALQSAELTPPPVETPPVDAAPTGSVDASMSDIPATPDAPVEAPIAAVGSEVANIPLPDADGKITIDFEQLFTTPGAGDTVAPVDVDAIAPGAPLETTPPAEEAPIDAAAMEPPAEAVPPVEGDIAAPASPDLVEPAAAAEAVPPVAPPEEEELPTPPVVESLDKFKSRLADVAFGVEGVYHGTMVTENTHDRLKDSLMGLLESLDKMLESGVITENQASQNEKRLEFLFLKLKEGTLANSYKTEKGKEEDPMGKSLKEYAAKLFESDDQERLAQDAASTGDTGVVTHKAATAHAKDASGLSPELSDLFKEELEGGSKTVDTASEAGTVDEPALPGTGKSVKKPLEQGKTGSVSEEVEAKGHAGFGDSSEKPVASPDMFFEIDEKELMEAVAAIRKENAEKKNAGKVDKGGWETAKPAAKSTAPKSVLKKDTVKEQAPMGGGMEEDLVLNVSLPDEIESELDMDDVDVDLMLSDDEMDLEGGEEETMDLEVGGDEEGDEEMEVSADLDVGGGDMGSEEDEMLLTDEGDDMDEVSDSPMTGPATDRRPGVPLAEARILKTARAREQKALRLLEATRTETKQLKTEMAETNLFLSKLLYLNKFLQREGLSRKVKQQIVEHLDRAGNLAEAKEIYLKIKRKLDESTSGGSSSIALAGSAAKPTAGGSAKLKESSNAASAGDEAIVGTWERWQKLANIGKGES